MMTAFWVVFALALLVLAACLFLYLLIPIVIIGLFILIVSHCGGSHGRSMVETTRDRSVESKDMPSGHHGQI
jgi:hypothetical protein